MTPVKVTFLMRTPLVVPTTAKHLDALLSWAAVQEADFADHDEPISMQHDTGIAKHHVGTAWCFMASCLEYEWLGEADQLHYIKRSKLEDFAGAWCDGLLNKRPYFDGARGTTKAGSYLQPIRQANRVSAYAVVDDMKRFEQLMNWVTHIGKLAHKDWGAVRSFEIAHDDQALSSWSKRNLPVESPFAIGAPRMMGGLVSPYWKRENHCVVAANQG